MTETTKFVVGLTGGIASGKSTVANLFKDYNVDVVSADEIARFLMRAGSYLVKEIDQIFQNEFNVPTLLNADYELDRALLREIIFNKPLARRRLDEITHPAIGKELVQRVLEAKSDYVICEIPLLIEANMQELVDRILVVETASETQISRIMERDKVSKEQAEKILDAQLTNEQRRAYADDIIVNNGSLEKIQNSVALLHQAYLKQATFHRTTGQSRSTGITLN